MIKTSPKLRKILSTYGELPTYLPPMPLFITGCMRSGTTFLADQLTSHPQLLKIGDELNTVWTEMGGANCLDKCEYKDENNADISKYTYNISHYFINFIHDSKSLKRHLMRGKNLLERKLGKIFYDWTDIIPVNKSTHLINKTRYVNALFPGSKFIIIIRDVYAQSSSLKVHFEKAFKKTGKRRYMPDRNKDCWHILNSSDINPLSFKTFPPHFELIPKMWLRLNQQVFHDLEHLKPKQFKVVSYEDMVLDQEKIFLELFDFLDLKKSHKKYENNISSRKILYKNTTTSGNPINKWQTHLTKEEKEQIEKVIGENQETYDFIRNKTEAMKIK